MGVGAVAISSLEKARKLLKKKTSPKSLKGCVNTIILDVQPQFSLKFMSLSETLVNVSCALFYILSGHSD